MRSNKVLFTVLYLLGAGLIAALFLLFVPAESRTDVKWMNLFIVYFVYTGIWGKYSLFYSSLERFSDNVPTLAMYWLSFGAYAVLAVAAMVVFWLLGVGFEKIFISKYNAKGLDTQRFHIEVVPVATVYDLATELFG